VPVPEVLVPEVLVKSDAKDQLDSVPLLGSDASGELADQLLDRVTRHQARQQEVDGDRHPRRDEIHRQATTEHPHALTRWWLATCSWRRGSSGSLAHPQLARTTNCVGRTMVRSTSSLPSMVDTNASTATAPNNPPDWRMVVRGGLKYLVNVMSSKPVMRMSSGTRRPL